MRLIWNLVIAELLKIRRNRALLLVAGFAVLFGPISAVFVFALAAWNPESRPDAMRILSYPNNYVTGGFTASYIGRLLSASAVAVVFFTEYRHDAWKVLVARQPARATMLGVKAVLAYAGTTVFVLAGIASWVVVSSLCAWSLAFAWDAENLSPSRFSALDANCFIAASVLDLVFFGAVAFAGVCLSRSQVVGLASALLLPVFLWFVENPTFAIMHPDAQIQNVFAYMLDHGPTIERSTAMFGYAIDPGWSLLLICGYALFLTLLGIHAFEDRDV